jgi:hypothetical protein
MKKSIQCWAARLAAMSLAFCLSGTLHAEETGTGQRIGEKIDHAMTKAGEGINRAAEATGRGLTKAAEATGHGIGKAVDATGRGLQTVGEKIQNVAHGTHAED